MLFGFVDISFFRNTNRQRRPVVVFESSSEGNLDDCGGCAWRRACGGFTNLSITASNDINEEVPHSLNQHGHSITAFGIGTHLVTCLRQPALGCVYKLVEIDGAPRIKLSEDVQKNYNSGQEGGVSVIPQEWRARC